MDDQLKAIIDSAVADGLSDEDIDLIVQEHQTRQTAAPAITGEQRRAQTLKQLGSELNLDKAGEQWQHVKDHPIETGLQLAIPGVMGAAAKYGGPLMKGAAAAAASPTGQSVIGAISGGYYGGIPGAIAGGMSGYGTGKATNTLTDMLTRYMGKSAASKEMIAGMSKAGADIADDLPPALKALMNGGNADDLAAAVSKPVAKAAQPATRQALENELTKRIDWRITDAVPIDAIKRDVSRGGSIIEAGESQIGLAERLAQLMKTPTPVAIQEATELAKALRQRGHITRGMK